MRPQMRAVLKYFDRYRSSALALIAANVVPLLGVLFWNWDAFQVVAVYWMENVVIGLINLLKITTCQPNPDEIDGEKFGFSREELEEIKKAGWKADLSLAVFKLIFGLFFVLHYGAFCYGHGALLFDLFDRGALPETMGELWQFLMQEHLAWGLVPLTASHLVSYFKNYIGRSEYRRTLPDRLMFQPYARVAVLHVVILFGGLVTWMFGNPLPLLIALVIGKTALDLAFHFRERLRNAFGWQD